MNAPVPASATQIPTGRSSAIVAATTASRVGWSGIRADPTRAGGYDSAPPTRRPRMLLVAAAFAADGPPRDDAPCDALAAWYSARALPAADLAPTEWWLADPPCPPAHQIIG